MEDRMYVHEDQPAGMVEAVIPNPLAGLVEAIVPSPSADTSGPPSQAVLLAFSGLKQVARGLSDVQRAGAPGALLSSLKGI